MEKWKYFIYAATTMSISIFFLYRAMTTPFSPDGSPEKAESSFLIYSVGIMSLLLTALFIYQGITTKINKKKKSK
ncbi:MAG: hypothetical protein N2746_05730 [Deltaproteobacteria bacterium]|nr:hypothetical protein [Deltaproteobacteria bacterium]